MTIKRIFIKTETGYKTADGRYEITVSDCNFTESKKVFTAHSVDADKDYIEVRDESLEALEKKGLRFLDSILYESEGKEPQKSLLVF